MTVWAIVVVVVCALNPPRRRLTLDVGSLASVARGAVAAFAVYVLGAATAAGLRGALDVSAPNVRVAAGLVLIAVGLHAVVSRIAPTPRDAPVSDVDERTAWLVPVGFPVLLRPDIALVALASEPTDVVPVGAALAIALSGVVVWWHTRGGHTAPVTRTERAISSALGALLVLGAVRIVLDGIFAL